MYICLYVCYFYRCYYYDWSLCFGKMQVKISQAISIWVQFSSSPADGRYLGVCEATATPDNCPVKMAEVEVESESKTAENDDLKTLKVLSHLQCCDVESGITCAVSNSTCIWMIGVLLLTFWEKWFCTAFRASELLLSIVNQLFQSVSSLL